MRLRVVTANIGRKQNIQQTRHDFAAVGLLRGLTGFQEIDEEPDPAPEHSFLRAAMGDRFNFAGMATRVPVAVPKSIRILDRRTVFGTSGVKKWSPDRYFSVVILEVKGLKEKALRRPGKSVVFINTHYPAGAYHGTRPVAAKRELIDRWDKQFLKHRELVKHYVDKGYTVIWTGDVNRVNMPKVHRDEVQVVTVGIDSISYIERSVKVRVKKRSSRRLYSDHDAQFADLDLS